MGSGSGPEDSHPETGPLWSNLRQSYPMARGINWAMRRSVNWEDVRCRALS